MECSLSTHRLNPCAFWWSCNKTDIGSAKPYEITRDYLLQTKGSNHVVWVWNVQDSANVAGDLSQSPRWVAL